MTGQVRTPEPVVPAPGGVEVDESAVGGVPVAGSDAVDGVGPGPDGAGPDGLAAQLDERTGDLQRITAEYANYRRRVDRDRQAVVTAAKAQVAGELLTVLDDIERAGQHGDLSGAFKAVAEKLVGALQGQGLEPFGSPGDAFDAGLHEAVQHSTSAEVAGPTVTAVLRRGYRFGDRVLRPAMVVVTDAETAAGGPGTV